MITSDRPFFKNRSLKGNLTRRDFFRLGIAGAIVFGLNKGCKTDTGAGTPLVLPEGVYELTDGRTLYDDFDGGGNLQTYNSQNLAEAGKISSRLWLNYPGTDITGGPAASGLLTVVNEDGQRFEYGLQERRVREISAYLVENPRPVTAFEREVLERLLNDKGITAVADVEAREFEKQVKVIQYVFNNRRELFNERGRKLAEIISAKGGSSLTQECLDDLVNQGFDETELFVLSRLLAEKQLYGNIEDSTLKKSPTRGGDIISRASSWKNELEEIIYVFDAEGRLIDAVPHMPGQPYHGAKKLFWRGLKDGRCETDKGPIVIEKGKIYGIAEVVSAGASGYALRMTNIEGFELRCYLYNPRDVEFADNKSFSGELMLSSKSEAEDFSAAFDYHTTIPEQPPGRSWFTQIGLRRDPEGDVFIMAQTCNYNLGYRTYKHLGPAQLDRWYNLGLDIVTKAEDSRLQDNEFRVDFFVDGVLKASDIPEDAALLLDPARTGSGPNRNLAVFREKGSGDVVALFDNIKAVYKNRIS